MAYFWKWIYGGIQCRLCASVPRSCGRLSAIACSSSGTVTQSGRCARPCVTVMGSRHRRAGVHTFAALGLFTCLAQLIVQRREIQRSPKLIIRLPECHLDTTRLQASRSDVQLFLVMTVWRPPPPANLRGAQSTWRTLTHLCAHRLSGAAAGWELGW
ncbi:hypothetical protein B0I37DRAFT_202457 [Chaetomium sp. MPI-CAGE-AT-0009]|nr:hypothetical protein B0I37DRAFT_202457 [Chaetomium sp. MPI-CAGE-AT-0009]